MEQGNGRDLLAKGVVGMGNPQSSPQLGGVCIERQHLIAVVMGYLGKPCLQDCSLVLIIPGCVLG